MSPGRQELFICCRLQSLCFLFGFHASPPSPWRALCASGGMANWNWVGADHRGLLFTVWARRHIGRNWSITVTVKEGHELIISGPYALVRHPIYTGLLLAFVGSALARAEWRGILAIALVFWSLWRKLHIEERWMSEAFGEAYQNYCRQVPALLPSLSTLLRLGCKY